MMRYLGMGLAALCLCAIPCHAAGDFGADAMRLSDILRLAPPAAAPAAVPAKTGQGGDEQLQRWRRMLQSGELTQADYDYLARTAAPPPQPQPAESRAEMTRRWQGLVRAGELTQDEYTSLVGGLNDLELMRSLAKSRSRNIARWQRMLKAGELTQADYDYLIKKSSPTPSLP